MSLPAPTISSLPPGAPEDSPAPGPEISVVVPIFNEEGTLRDLHARVSAALAGESFEMVLVDDGSRDRSRPILEELAASHPEVVVVELVRNFGQHPAVLAGFSVATSRILRTRSRASSPCCAPGTTTSARSVPDAATRGCAVRSRPR